MRSVAQSVQDICRSAPDAAATESMLHLPFPAIDLFSPLAFRVTHVPCALAKLWNLPVADFDRKP